MKPRDLKSASLFLAALLTVQGCGTSYSILRRSGFPNPPVQRLGVIVLGFDDQTAQYQAVGEKFEDILERSLEPEKVKVLQNLYTAPSQGAQWATRRNAFRPVTRRGALSRLESGGRVGVYALTTAEFSLMGAADRRRLGEMLGADIAITGTVENLSFDDAPADMAALAVFGWLTSEAAREGVKLGKASFRLNVMSLRNGRVLLTETVDGIYSARGVSRREAMAYAVQNASDIFVRRLLR